MPSTPVDNKANAMAFYDPMFNQCDPRSAIERFTGNVYIQHNSHVADGKEAFIIYFERMATTFSGKSVPFERSVAEDDLIVLHCHRFGRTATSTLASTPSAST
ncbi:nuclear transport factor 2 family protein [Falsirhodobacter sp. 1013]|uniref:nuclear transport factor 2 family protein n=1 Tax=Falsirhodobacter sp. 1013 TaxID=3417566 RepID=UPI003EBD6FBF